MYQLKQRRTSLKNVVLKFKKKKKGLVVQPYACSSSLLDVHQLQNQPVNEEGPNIRLVKITRH